MNTKIVRLLKGNSLVEVLSSLSLLALLFLIGLMLFHRLTGPMSPVEMQKSRALTESYLYEPLAIPIEESEEREIMGRLLVRKIELLTSDLYWIQVSCFMGHQQVDHRNRIIRLKP